ncbi:hypothetical protein [Roseovarius pacificus]|uniref:hypothetical protein n=1 Tax=Roseovarius pacificus TaxID=337701 RepID=UPI002A18816C|nr:hypothetical protein [Roseovarius pacificus]
MSWGAAQYIYYAVHNPKEMPADPTEGQAVHAADPAVAEKIRDIRRRVKVAHDTAKSRGQHGR